MAMSDPLAEALRNAWPSRSWEGLTLVCGCGWETDMISSGRHARDCEDEFDAHMFEHLAEAARAFIAGEIEAERNRTDDFAMEAHWEAAIDAAEATVRREP